MVAWSVGSGVPPAARNQRESPRPDAVAETAKLGSGLSTVYHALDRLVSLYGLDDAAVVVEVPGFGHQIFRAGRRPLGPDPHRWREAPPGLYLDPPLADPVLDELMVAVAALALRFDHRGSARELAPIASGPTDHTSRGATA